MVDWNVNINLLQRSSTLTKIFERVETVNWNDITSSLQILGDEFDSEQLR